MLARFSYPLAYRENIFRWADAEKLHPYLVAAVIRNESRFRPDATSSQGARGLMQVMPETGAWAAKQMGITFQANQLYQAEYNIRIGTWYLANLRREFGGDIVLALAAYNAGRGNVRQWLTDKRWTGEHATLDQIPFPETRLYVGKVLRDFERYRRIYGEP